MLKGVNLREMLPLAALSVVLILTLALSTHVASVSAPSEQSGNFHIEKTLRLYRECAGAKSLEVWVRLIAGAFPIQT
jgi:hypothetical protein